ncbi:MAG: zf-HC2 domain-containing protein [Actinomycetota bacterium]|nr:zf-HC2 domain-containing protein [Actinomycetota bacterium]MDA8071709.1 zf-HC2 domain-containing protein [Actinomycetota bacterium]
MSFSGRRSGARGSASTALVCAVAREAISARLDGEPVPTAPGLLDAHLEACADCAAHVAGAVALRPLLAVRVPRTPPAGLVADLAPRLPGVAAECRYGEDLVPALRRQLRVARRSPAQARVRPLALAAAALAVVVFLAADFPVHVHVDPTAPATPCTASLREHPGYPFLPHT